MKTKTEYFISCGDIYNSTLNTIEYTKKTYSVRTAKRCNKLFNHIKEKYPNYFVRIDVIKSTNKVVNNIDGKSTKKIISHKKYLHRPQNEKKTS